MLGSAAGRDKAQSGADRGRSGERGDLAHEQRWCSFLRVGLSRSSGSMRCRPIVPTAVTERGDYGRRVLRRVNITEPAMAQLRWDLSIPGGSQRRTGIVPVGVRVTASGFGTTNNQAAALSTPTRRTPRC